MAALPPPGPLNAITDVAGIRVGNAEDLGLCTGVTVVLPDAPAVAAVDCRGGGPGTRETDALAPGRTVEAVHAVVLSGGSAYGLAAADGAMGWLRAQGRGYRLGAALVPIVPAAILFDLLTPEPAQWDAPPWHALGHAACAAAGRAIRLGNAGAGLGCRAGALKGGLGTASVADADLRVGALAAVNSMGEVVVPGSRSFWAGALEQAGELGRPPPPAPAPEALGVDFAAASPRNTTLGVVATDAALSRDQALRVAIMAQDGIARAIRPAHGPLDGDTVFVLATGARALADPLADLGRIGLFAGDALARAIMRGVHAAEGLPGLPAWRDLA